MKARQTLILCAVALCATLTLGAQTPEWLWAIQAGGTFNEVGKNIVMDGQGNQYVTGYFEGTASFGSYTLTSSVWPDIFVAKLDASGNWLWAVQANGAYWDQRYCIGMDANGNCYLTGTFENSANFGSYTLTSIGSADIFVAKLDANGNWIWAVRAGGWNYDRNRGISVDAVGNCYLTGRFQSWIDFGSYSLTSSGGSDIFVAKLNTNGNWLWAKRAGGTLYDSGDGIAVDAAGNCYMTGDFAGSANFGPYTLTSSGDEDIFAAKLDTNGSWLWVVRAGGPLNDKGFGIALDVIGNANLTGSFGGSAAFGPYSLTSSGYADTFVAKLDTNGNWLWAQQAGGPDYNVYVSFIEIDSACCCYLIGSFWGSANFGPYTLTSSGSYDIFAAKLDSSGNWLWAVRAGGTSDDLGYGIAVDAAGNCYLTGSFEGSVDFGPYMLTSSDGSDIFVGKLSGLLQVDFTSDIVTGPEPLTVQLADQSLPGLYPITNWDWNFGDGNTSSQQHPTHTYLTPGTYTVSLTVTDQNNQSSTKVRPDYITVIEGIHAVELLTLDHYSYGSVYLEEQSPWQPVALANTGNVTLTVADAWFHAQPSQFELLWPQRDLIIPPGAADTLWVRFSPQQVGSVIDTLYIANDSNNQPLLKIRLTGSGEYVLPKWPENVLLSINGYDVTICWDAVTQNLHNQPITPDYYLIFVSDNPCAQFVFHGATPNLQYTVPLTALLQPRMFYRVVAYKYYGRGVFDPQSFGLVPGTPMEEVLKLLP